MGQLGMSQENLLRMLEEKGISAGTQFSAKKLREAIAEAIDANNRELEKNIDRKVSEAVARVIFGEAKKMR